MGKHGFSFSWKRASGISAAKGRVSRSIGIPLTKSGRQRKFGPLGIGLFGSRHEPRSSSRFNERAGSHMLLTKCPSCGHKHQVRSTTLGAIKKCVACDSKFQVVRHRSPIDRFLSFVFWAGATIVTLVLVIIGVALFIARSSQPQSSPASLPPPAIHSAASSPIQPLIKTAILQPVQPATTQSAAPTREEVLTALYRTPTYIAARKTLDEIDAKRLHAIDNPQNSNVASLAQEWIEAKNAIGRMEQAALAGVPAPTTRIVATPTQNRSDPTTAPALTDLSPSDSDAQSPTVGGADRSVRVRGYTKSNGTYVPPYTRSAPGSGSGHGGGHR